MKLTNLFLLVTVFNVIASETYSQYAMLNLDMKDVPVQTVLSAIEDQSEFFFLYSSKMIDVARKVDIKVENKNITEVLNDLLAKTDIRYVVKDRQILLMDKEMETANLLQQNRVTGTVSDENGNPLPGVTVLVKGTTLGTLTDASGKYAVDNVPQNATLAFSFVGMSAQEIPADGKRVIDVVLKEEAIGLKEVVVVGYGTQKKVNLTGSVSSITSDKLAVVPTANVSTLLYGNLPGLITLQRSGRPGLDDVSLSIRGFSNALVVVDGVVGRSFARLDPNEIESFTILKDAASAAVYGVSGGNGVILVTTKKGKIGKPEFTYTANFGVQHITTYPDFVTSEQYAILKNEAAINAGGNPVYTQEEIDKYRLGTDPDYPNFDYFDYMVTDFPPQFQQNISVRGGSEKIKYYFLLGQLTQASIWKGADEDYDKYNFRSNVDASITDNFDISIEFGGRVEDRIQMTEADASMGSWFQYQWPIFNPKTPDGKIQSTNYGLTAYLDRDLTGYSSSQRNVYEGGLTLNYRVPFVKGLSASLKVARDMYYYDTKLWTKKYISYTWDKASQTSVQAATRGTDALSMSNSKSGYTRVISSLNYERSFAENHNIKALLVYEVSEDKSVGLGASRTGYIVPIDQIFAGPDLGKSNSGTASDNGRESYVGRLNYDYSGKYLFEYSFRYDGSAKFPPDKRWGFFSGVSGGWRISEESFMKDRFSALDNLKLRASWGTLGSDNTGNFQFLTGFSYPSNKYIFGGTTATSGINDSGTPNPNITWEKSQIYDIGLDISLWKRLLEVETDVFYRKRDGLLAKRSTQLPITYGATLPDENLNSDDARGFEILVGHNATRGDLHYRITTTFAYTRLKNLHLEQRTFNNQYDNWRNNNENRWKNKFWGYKALGQFQSMEDIYSSPVQDTRANSTLRPGDIKYEDFNKDGVIDANDIQLIGRSDVPEINYSLGGNLSWRRFSLDMNWQGAANFNVEVHSFARSPFWASQTAFAFFMDRWHRADPWDPNSDWVPGKYPSTFNAGAPNNDKSSTFWLKDATYLRLKSLSVTYDLENELMKKWGVKGLAVSLSGQNLLTFSGLDFIDPENANGRLNYYPQQMTFNIGIHLTF